MILENGMLSVEVLEHNALVLQVDCPQADTFGIWAPYKSGSPFVCLEPWSCICDASDSHGVLPER